MQKTRIVLMVITVILILFWLFDPSLIQNKILGLASCSLVLLSLVISYLDTRNKEKKK